MAVAGRTGEPGTDDGMMQLLRPDGELMADLLPAGFTVTAELCRGFYRDMVLARRLDTEALALQRQGELGLWLMALGQEAAQVGSIRAVSPADYVFPSYREHAAALCRGIPPRELLAQWRGVAHSGWDPGQHRFHFCTIVLGAQLLHATGYALGVRRDGADELVLAYFGDGATSQGDANEAFNWAAVTAAPVLFFCQNNQWAISTPVSRQSRVPLSERGRGFGMPAVRVDGNDVLAVHAVTRAAADRVRSGAGPVFVEAVTHRQAGHSTSDDPRRYRTPAEVDLWAGRDPLVRLRRLLDRAGWADRGFLDQLDRDADELAERTRRECLAMADPDLKDMFEHVYVDATRRGIEEREAYLTYRSSLD